MGFMVSLESEASHHEMCLHTQFEGYRFPAMSYLNRFQVYLTILAISFLKLTQIVEGSK